jgi:hypothetical protein
MDGRSTPCASSERKPCMRGEQLRRHELSKPQRTIAALTGYRDKDFPTATARRAAPAVSR